MRLVCALLAITLTAMPAVATGISVGSVLAEMNARRVAEGMPALRLDERLQSAAQDRMRDMEEQAYWAHLRPDGRTPFDAVKLRGYDFQYAGENLARGFDTSEVLVESWMESEGHRRNVMSPLYQECGIAIIEGSTLGRAAGHSVVVLFARPRAGLQTAAAH